MNLTCNKEGCTLAETGICILNHVPETCPDRIASLVSQTSTYSTPVSNAVLEPPSQNATFSPSQTISLAKIETMMKTDYCKIVGILGAPGTGKTAGLVSLYLLLAHAKLEGFKFIDSKSIMGFEEISRGARQWNTTKPPSDLTVHTELKDERMAGFLHLRLKQDSGKKVHLLLTDLPGEWTNDLIDSNRTDRLEFLKSCERIWLTINGEEIAKPTTRMHCLHRLTLIIDRLAVFFKNKIPSISIIVTHSDKSGTVAANFENIIAKYRPIVDIKIIEIASFSLDDKVKPGTGISELIADLMKLRVKEEANFWMGQSVSQSRSILKYRN